MNRRVRIAVDVGGTFTDVILDDPGTGRVESVKVLTRPRDLAGGVMAGIAAALDVAGLEGDTVREIVHGSTTGTNALIERKGAKVGLLTTRGFRDVLEIGRIMRPDAGLYDFSVDLPLPLVPRRLRLEAVERLDHKGGVLIPLDDDSVAAAGDVFEREGVEAVAVCFLYSFLNPAHEERAAEILSQRLPDIPISLSCRVCPEYREYERTSTVVMDAYLTPVMRTYLENLEGKIREELGDARLFVIQANGGSTSVAAAKERAVTTVNSGPAGGVVAAAFYGARQGRAKIVSADMGGTSFDIGLVEDGRSAVTTEGAFQGLPVRIPIIDLHIIGAGGGSIAWIDPGGALAVGPMSAGADPGPACYGKGGDAPTVTDANLVLGRLNPDYFNAGKIVLSAEASRKVVEELGSGLGFGPEETALGIIKVVNANMVKGIATVTIQRGIDIREFSLLSFGGAGGSHAVDLGLELGMREVIVPPLPGTFSALGLLVTETRHDYVAALTPMGVEEAEGEELERIFSGLEREGLDQLQAEGFAPEDVKLIRMADLKVKGQTYELTLPVPGRPPVTAEVLADLARDFAALYRERYAFFFEDETLLLVNLRVSALGLNRPLALPEDEEGPEDPSPASKGQRPVYFEEEKWVDCKVYERSRLTAGMVVPGPAVIEEETSSTLLPAGREARVLNDGGLIIPLAG